MYEDPDEYLAPLPTFPRMTQETSSDESDDDSDVEIMSTVNEQDHEPVTLSEYFGKIDLDEKSDTEEEDENHSHLHRPLVA